MRINKPTKCSKRSCDRDIYSNEDHCILHSENPEKDNTSFSKKLFRSILGDCLTTGDAGDILLDSIIFPMGFDISIFLKPFLNSQKTLKNITFTNCKFNNDINLIGINGAELVFEFNNAGSVNLERLKFESVRMHDNCFNDLQIVESELKYLNLYTTATAGMELEKINNFFQIANTIKFFRINNQIFDTFHIAMAELKDSFNLDNITTHNFMIRDSVFYENVNLKEIKSSKNFILDRCIIQKPRLFTISQSDLSNSGFSGTDISAINLIDNKWRGDGKKQIKILDHYLAEKGTPYDNKALPFKKVTPVECAETYRQLKINFESKGNYIDAGDFHHGEMEMRRLSDGTLFSIYGMCQ